MTCQFTKGRDTINAAYRSEPKCHEARIDEIVQEIKDFDKSNEQQKPSKSQKCGSDEVPTIRTVADVAVIVGNCMIIDDVKLVIHQLGTSHDKCRV